MMKLRIKKYNMIWTSALSSGKINKYEYPTSEEILPSTQKQIIEQAKFTYSSPVKAFEKSKNNWRSRKKQIYALKDLKLKDQTKSIEAIFPKDYESDEIKNELHKIKRYKNKVFRDNLFYESSKQVQAGESSWKYL